MKTCPKCNGKYFDDDEYCSECNIQLIDNNEYNEILAELQMMTLEERNKHQYEKRYRVTYKYNYCYGNSDGISSVSTPPSSTVNKETNIPKCPTCGSTNIRRISTAEKATGVILFGIFSNKRKYQFECQNPNCKYKW